MAELHLSQHRVLAEGLSYLNEQERQQAEAMAEGESVEQVRRKEGRKARARQHFAEQRGIS